MREACLVIDKQPGPTSFDLVRQVKRLVGGEKVGHTGSLDPFASGTLVLLVGRATKLSNTLLNADKRYRAVLKIGEATDSMDRTGNVTESGDVPMLSTAEMEKEVKKFEGEWLQTPPMYSAKKIKGVRLYQLARQNISVRREPIAVQLYEMKYLGFESPYLTFEVHCSKGTYVRSLADELARRMHTVGHLYELRRLSCGPFGIEEAVSLETLDKNLDAELERGYRNYVRLLRTEALVRSQRAPHLPMGLHGGTSLLN